jgi:hypothetical protein
MQYIYYIFYSELIKSFFHQFHYHCPYFQIINPIVCEAQLPKYNRTCNDVIMGLSPVALSL